MSIKGLDTGVPENPFGLSIGDLMAALLLIFVLLLASTLLRLQEEFDRQSNIAEEYSSIKAKLYEELVEEFRDDLKKWDADLDSVTLSIRFKEPKVLFGQGASNVKRQFEDILNNFFPRYIEILTRPDFRENIEEIRIEGHTNSDPPNWTSSPDFAYLYNMELSQDRTRNVLRYCLQTIHASPYLNWVKQNLTANGLSSSKPIHIKDTAIEDKLASRRVEFRIRTNAERKIEEILNKRGSD
jgi:outer membrane protein OmpA-like peptidoglycan-associated protein